MGYPTCPHLQHRPHTSYPHGEITSNPLAILWQGVCRSGLVFAHCLPAVRAGSPAPRCSPWCTRRRSPSPCSTCLWTGSGPPPPLPRGESRRGRASQRIGPIALHPESNRRRRPLDIVMRRVRPETPPRGPHPRHARPLPAGRGAWCCWPAPGTGRRAATPPRSSRPGPRASKPRKLDT